MTGEGVLSVCEERAVVQVVCGDGVTVIGEGVLLFCVGVYTVSVLAVLVTDKELAWI